MFSFMMMKHTKREECFLPNSKNCRALDTHENAHKDRIDVIIHLLMVVVNKRQQDNKNIYENKDHCEQSKQDMLNDPSDVKPNGAEK